MRNYFLEIGRIRIILLSLLFASFASATITPALALDIRTIDLPHAPIYVPPMVKEESVSTYVPSEAAPGQGLAVNMIYTAKQRYKDGAPVVVVVPGGNGSQGLDFDMHAAQQGLVEVRFAFQGGGKPGFVSSGIYDNRGVHSQEALRDVLRFAAGEIPDFQGRKISELLPYRLSNKTIGAVGWSNGGNTLLVTVGKFGEQLPFVAWMAFYESPVGAMFYPPSLGGATDMTLNKHYRQGTGATGQVLVDWRKLKYAVDASKAPGSHKRQDEPELPGVAFFDENGNGIWDETSEFALPYATDLGVEKQIYPPAVTRALFALPEFQPPKEKESLVLDLSAKTDQSMPVASYAESLAYFRERDGSLYIKQIIEQHPDMAFAIFASHLDHLQRQPDHPHIALLYNTILANKPKFLRLNPSATYVASVSWMKEGAFIENKPNSSIEADTIEQYLEPEGLLPVYSYMEAACCELADRVHTNKWMRILDQPLINYANGAKPPEDPKAKPKPAPPKDKSKEESSSNDKADDGKGTSSSKTQPGKKTSTTAKKSKPSTSGSTTKVTPGPPESSTPKDWPFKAK